MLLTAFQLMIVLTLFLYLRPWLLITVTLRFRRRVCNKPYFAKDIYEQRWQRANNQQFCCYNVDAVLFLGHD